MADLPGQPRRKSRRKKKGAHVPGSIGGIIPDKEIEQERERIEPKLRKLPDDAPEDLAEKLFGNLPRGPRV